MTGTHRRAMDGGTLNVPFLEYRETVSLWPRTARIWQA